MNRQVKPMLRTTVLASAIAATLLAAAPTAHAASERQSMEELRNTVVNLLQTLVDQGVMTKEKAAQLVAAAQEKAAADAAASEKVEDGAVRVTYVPEVVREQLRNEVAEQLRGEVAAQVVATAKEQQWGVPGALPEWLSRVTWSGDVRVRTRGDLFDSANAEGVQLDFDTINARGGIGRAGLAAFANVSEERYRMQVRARLAIEGRITPTLVAGARLVTGNLRNPVSLNDNLGQYGARFNAAFDQAYIRWEPRNAAGFRWMTVQGGRTASPWLTPTDLIFDRDVAFDGVSATVRLPFTQNRQSSHAFFTLGAHPLEELELASKDKWLLAAQLGSELRFGPDHRLQVAAALYDFTNVQGRRNTLDSDVLDFTAPRVLRRGNTLFDIRNDTDINTNLFALAGQYRLVNATVVYEVPVAGRQLSLSADYVKNIGWKADDVQRISGITADERTTGYQFEAAYGDRVLTEPWDWRVAFSYRYLQRDAVLDAFTDSDFHGGGTDAQGFIIGGELVLMSGLSMRARYMTADEIDGPLFAPGAQLTQDVVMVDMAARF